MKNENHYNKIEDTLIQSEKRSLTWLENSPVCTKIIDPDFNLRYMSSAGINGLKIENVCEHYGKPYPFYFFPEKAKSDMLKSLQEVKDTGKTVRMEMMALDLDRGEHWFDSTLSPIFLENGELDYLLVVSTEISQRKMAEVQIKKMNEELIKSNAELREAKRKAEESEQLKTQFLANMSHEIRTPLNSILGFSSLLKINKNLDEEEKQNFYDLIEDGGSRLLRLIGDIVDISKLDTNQLSINNGNCHLNDLLDRLESQLSFQMKSNQVRLVCTKGLPDDECLTVVDEIRLAQVLSNLIENAGKFTEKGIIEFGYSVSKDELTFYVKDSGIGIDSDRIDHIFDRFTQLDDRLKVPTAGTGLGLSIAKELVTLMGGKIWVKSEVGNGSTFYFTIPKLHELNGSKGNDRIEEALSESPTAKVLIVDDEEVNCIYLKAILKPYGFELLRAKNGQEAVDLVKQNPDLALVLMDIRMPVLDGFEATEEIRKANKDIPIVAQTAYVMAEDKQRAASLGFNDYLEKPITKDQLDEVVKKFALVGVAF